jgi:hypothetical protein
MHLTAPGYVLLVAPLLTCGVWLLARSDAPSHHTDATPAEETLLIVGTLAILWIIVSAAASYA